MTTTNNKKRDLLDVLKQLTKQLVQKCLEAEMDTHLGYEKNEQAGKSAENRRNGYSKKPCSRTRARFRLVFRAIETAILSRRSCRNTKRV